MSVETNAEGVNSLGEMGGESDVLPELALQEDFLERTEQIG